MKRTISILFLFALITAGATLFAAGGKAKPPPPAAPQAHSQETACENATGPNLLQNPSFEGDYSAYVPPGGHPDCPTGTCQTAQMADGWTPYWRSHDPSDPPEIIRMPEYKPAEIETAPNRVHEGDRAQQYFTFSSTHEAGFYQRVPVTPGQLYCFSIWAHSWSADWDDPISNTELEQRLGIDPTGGTDWQSATVFWGGRFQQYDEYGLYSLVAQAQGSHMTVFTWSRPVWPVKHNDVYWDQSWLSAVALDLEARPGSVVFMAKAGEPQILSQTVDIDLGGDPGPTWSVALQPGGSLSVSLDKSEGHFEQDLTVSVNSSGYALGTYTADLLVTSEPDLPNSPLTIPVTLIVVSDIHNTYLSTVSTP